MCVCVCVMNPQDTLAEENLYTKMSISMGLLGGYHWTMDLHNVPPIFVKARHVSGWPFTLNIEQFSNGCKHALATVDVSEIAV